MTAGSFGVSMRFFIGVCIFNLFFFTSCNERIKLNYKLASADGRWLTAIEKTQKTYEELLRKGSILYLDFVTQGNNNYTETSIHLFTLKKYREIKIHSVEFYFENMNKKILLNKTISLKEHEEIFQADEKPISSITVYSDYIYFSKNSVRFNFQDIFDKNKEDVGKNLKLFLNVNYSLDNEALITQVLEYTVYVSEHVRQPPGWLYRLFPHM